MASSVPPTHPPSSEALHAPLLPALLLPARCSWPIGSGPDVQHVSLPLLELRDERVGRGGVGEPGGAPVLHEDGVQRRMHVLGHVRRIAAHVYVGIVLQAGSSRRATRWVSTASSES